jgi:hypothetical protein
VDPLAEEFRLEREVEAAPGGEDRRRVAASPVEMEPQ